MKVSKFSKVVCLSFGLMIGEGAFAAEKIVDKDLLEKNYISCLVGGVKNNCLSTTLISHLDDRVKNDDLAAKMEGFLVKWLEGKSVYAVHPADKITKASVYENRSYIVERSDGAFLGFYVGFIKTKNEWHIYDLQTGYSDAFIRGMLGMQRFYSPQ